MSMTLEEAIKLLKQYQGYDPMFPDGETLKHAFDLTDETVDILLTALRPVSREQVEKVWGGEWEFDAAEPNGKFGGIRCSKCHAAVSFGGENAFHNAKAFDSFCPFCGAPMTDEAVEVVMERMEKLKNADTNY